MAAGNPKTARYKILPAIGGNRYRFFCEVSGMALCTTVPIRAGTREQALQTAWENEGRRHFNQCGICGRWVSDVMYNADTGACVICSPWEDAPLFCPNCGSRALPENSFCCQCGEKLLYKGVRPYE